MSYVIIERIYVYAY